MTKNTQTPEKSMDEIMDSIRKTITEDMNPSPQETAPIKKDLSKTEDVLELTQAVMEDGTVIDLTKTEEAKEMSKESQTIQEEEPTVEAFFENAQAEEAPEALGSDLVSNAVMEESVAALSMLSEVTKPSPTSPSIPLEAVGTQTVEALMRELLRPMLKDWLDAHLPSLVKWVVTEEIEKIVKQSGRG